MKEEILKEFREGIEHMRCPSISGGNVDDFVFNENDIDKIENFWLSKLVEEYKRGYNECLKEQGKVGEKYQHLYL